MTDERDPGHQAPRTGFLRHNSPLGFEFLEAFGRHRAHHPSRPSRHTAGQPHRRRPVRSWPL